MVRKKRSIVWTTPKNELQALLDKSYSFVKVLEELGLNGYSGNHRTLSLRIKEDGLSIEALETNRKKFTKNHLQTITKKNKMLSSDIFKKDSTFTRGQSLKKRMLAEGICKEVCAVCGIIPQWNDKPLSLQVDHKNGVHNDNRKSNIRLICPNCHSQTETYSGKKTRDKW